MACLQLSDPDLFRSVVENVECAVYLVDTDKKVVFWNHGAERLTGFLALEMLGRPYREDLVVSNSSEDANAPHRGGCMLAEALREGHVKEGEALVLHRQGHRIPVRARVFPLRDPRGRVVGGAETLIEHVTEERERAVPSGVTYFADELVALSTFHDTASQLFKQVSTAGQRQLPFGVLCIEVRDLEKHAARNGRPVVEAILRTVGHELRTAVHATDFVGHWKGNRFLAVVETATLGMLERTAQRLQKLIGLSTVSWWGDKLSLQISVGGSVMRPDDSAESLVQRVEKALDNCPNLEEGCLLVP
jgi:PAS domain S-box-containing protein/diguanylate cyclase (GGDEF)-like protein